MRIARVDVEGQPSFAVVEGCSVNDERRQDGRTSQMLLDAWSLVAYVSEAMTLEPGDVVLTGTPSGVGPIEVGDVVSVEIEGIGMLANPVTAPPG